MNNLKKRVKTKNGEIFYFVTLAYAGMSKKIVYFVLNEENKPIKRIDFSMWDDFSFSAWQNDDYEKQKEINQIDFVIDEENLLYVPLNNFLGIDEKFILDDDETSEENKKTMQILREDGKIKIIFRNRKEQDTEECLRDKFTIFVKNILYDGRSKLDYLYENKKMKLLEEESKNLKNDDRLELYDILNKNGRLNEIDDKKRLRDLFKDFEITLFPKEKEEQER